MKLCRKRVLLALATTILIADAARAVPGSATPWVRGSWTMQEGTGDRLADQSDYGNHGMATRAAWVRTDGKATLKFTPANKSFVEVAHSPSLDLTGMFTIHLQVKTYGSTGNFQGLSFQAGREQCQGKGPVPVGPEPSLGVDLHDLCRRQGELLAAPQRHLPETQSLVRCRGHLRRLLAAGDPERGRPRSSDRCHGVAATGRGAGHPAQRQPRASGMDRIGRRVFQRRNARTSASSTTWRKQSPGSSGRASTTRSLPRPRMCRINSLFPLATFPSRV